MALPPGIYNIRIPSGSNVVCPIGMGNGLTIAAPTQNANQKWFVNGGVIMSMVSGQVTFVGGDLTTSADDFFPWNINIIVENPVAPSWSGTINNRGHLWNINVNHVEPNDGNAVVLTFVPV